MIVNIIRISEGFVSVGPNLPGGPEQYFQNVAETTFVIKSVLYNVQTLILDGVVVCIILFCIVFSARVLRCFLVFGASLISRDVEAVSLIALNLHI
jgi:hypothetical protein